MLSNTPALYAPFDMTTGHGPWPPVGYTGASPNVQINGRFVHKVGDTTLPHYANLQTPPDLHSDTISTGSPTVMVNGTPMAVIGSQLTSPVGPAGTVASFGAFTVVVDSQGAAGSSVGDATAPETPPDDEFPPDDGGSFELY